LLIFPKKKTKYVLPLLVFFVLGWNEIKINMYHKLRL
jgi:hypothetical protein